MNSTQKTLESAEQKSGELRRKLGLPEAPRRILVADDEHIVATGLVAQLAELGYTSVGPATSGELALRLARTSQPDMAMLDIRMPRPDGLEVARTLMAETATPSIIVSAYASTEYTVRAARVGVFAFLVKPVAVEQLRATIDVAWGRYLEYVCKSAEADDLLRRLEERKVIEQAKWLLVERKHIGEPEALKLLQERARSSRRPLIEIAKSVIEAGAVL